MTELSRDWLDGLIEGIERDKYNALAITNPAQDSFTHARREGMKDLAAAILAAPSVPLSPDDEIAREVLAERKRQDAKWGEQNHGDWEWISILTEEVGEAATEANEANFVSGSNRGDYGKLRAELVQVAAVAMAHVACIDRRAAAPEPPTPESEK